MEKGRNEFKKRLWTDEEDNILKEYIRVHGKGKWNRVAQVTGLKRCGKSCRLRWINYLSPGVERGRFSDQEDDLIIRLHNLLGNRWSLIAGRVPGRSDNQVKNHWNTHLSKKLGIGKEKTRVIKTLKHLDSPSTESLSMSPFKDINGGSDDQKTGEDGSLGAVEDPSMQELCMIEDNHNSFRFYSDYVSEQLPDLMEFLNGDSLDFLSHGL